MNKKIISFLLLLLFACSSQLQVLAATFSDVPENHEYYVATEFLKSQGVIQGYDDGTFRPDQKLNRAEALKIILVGSKLTVPDETSAPFPDVQMGQWYTKYVAYAKDQGIIGGNDDGTFAPGRTVSRAEFLKMVLTLNHFKKENWEGRQLYDDVPKDAWYAPYMNFAGTTGLIRPTDAKVDPGKELTRGEITEIMYLLYVVLNGKNTDFLINQAEQHIIQIERYMDIQNAVLAKRASELAVDFTQQAYTLKPDDTTVLSIAKIAKAYDYVVTSFVAAVQKNKDLATQFANMAIDKATEAWQVDNNVQSIAAHIKSRANSILDQLASQ